MCKSLAGRFVNKGLLLGAAALCYGQIFVTGIRWHLLLISQGVRLKFKDTLALNMIGTLFNTVIPGAVGGDVMKGYYLSRRAPGRRTQALTTLLIDRVVGLLALLLVSILAASWNSDLVRQSHGIQVLLAIAAAGACRRCWGICRRAGSRQPLAVDHRTTGGAVPPCADFPKGVAGHHPVPASQRCPCAGGADQPLQPWSGNRDVLFVRSGARDGTREYEHRTVSAGCPAWTGDDSNSDIPGRSRRRPGCVFYFILAAARLLGATWDPKPAQCFSWL